MRTLPIVAFCLLLSGCTKRTDLDSLPPVTRVSILKHPFARTDLFRPHLDAGKIPGLVAFIDGQRHGWTRAYAGGFGPPSPVYYANLFEGDKYVGYFAVGAGVLPGSSALFEVSYGDLYARKRVTRSEANQFLDLIGVGGDLSDNPDKELKAQIASRVPTHRPAGSPEPPAKFQPGDRVRVKVTQAEGRVCLRTKFFRENLYFVTLLESYHVLHPTGEREQRAAAHAASVAWAKEWARSQGSTVADSESAFPEYQPRPWHEEGPFYESDLEPAP